jgi:hypothetical protein
VGATSFTMPITTPARINKLVLKAYPQKLTVHRPKAGRTYRVNGRVIGRAKLCWDTPGTFYIA